MKPDWHELARLLADHPDIIIATMDTDANEKVCVTLHVHCHYSL